MERSDRIIRFIELNLVVPEGAHVGQQIKLREWQKDIIRQIYDTPTRQAIVSMGRKNGKTALIAMLVLAHLVGPEWVRNSQIYSSAQSREQAGIVFSLAAKMVRMSDELSDPNMVVVRESAKELFSPHSGVRYKALAAEATTAYGFSPVLVIHDELGQVRGERSELYDALETAMGGHAEPLSIVISTQAPGAADLLSMLMDYATTGADPRQKLILFAADETDPIDDEAVWRKANPALGDFLSLSELRGLSEKAVKMPSFESAFRNLHLNQRVSAQDQLFSPSVWEANCQPADADAFAEGPVYGGLDLSARQDLTSLVLVAEKPAGVWNVRAEFWSPAATLRERAERDRAPYDLWARQGWIEAVPGVTIDYDFVALRLAEIRSECDLRTIRYDRWRIEDLKAALGKIGVTVPLAEMGQGYRDMAPALDALESVALQRKLRVGRNPVLTMCAANAVVTTDAAGNRKFDKAKTSARIDGMLSLAMAISAATTNTKRAPNIRALIG
jgi:phage terminase large subunit-like protein